jgi:2-polyprenyl-3-methyl-5-hydroxy-6-metoxy-1,4-benzoquinol methylase
MAANYLQVRDSWSAQIAREAALLEAQLKSINVNTLPLDPHFRDYFRQHHLGKRVRYSLQNSAHILYDTVQLAARSPQELTLVDYGAGLGTLYLLAGKLGFKQVWYNDYLPEWAAAARVIAEAVQTNVHQYVTGGIDLLIQAAEQEESLLHIIASRNVIEHIYSLEDFYQRIAAHHPHAIVYSTTTANYHNPVMRWKHRQLHRFTEQTYYLSRRAERIKTWWPKATSEQIQTLVPLTRGLNQPDFQQAVKQFQHTHQLPILPSNLYTNTCDPDTGYWCERLLPERDHRTLAEAAGFQFACTAGYWDTHYSNLFLNGLGITLNALRPIMGRHQKMVVPFINLIAWNDD